MHGKNTHGFCSLKARHKVWSSVSGTVKKNPCWWNNEAIYQTCINYVCSFSVLNTGGPSTLAKISDFVSNLCYRWRVMLRSPWVSQHPTSPKWKLDCVHVPQHGLSRTTAPRGESPFSCCSLPLSPRMMLMLVITPEVPQTPRVPGQAFPRGRRMVTISISLELNAILIKSIWSSTGFLWDSAAILKLLPIFKNNAKPSGKSTAPAPTSCCSKPQAEGASGSLHPSLGEPRWHWFNQMKLLVEAHFPHFGKKKSVEMAECCFKFNSKVLRRSKQPNFMFSTSM